MQLEVFTLCLRCVYAAFTLIELSIVLMIIGLLAGGVLVGKDMIKAATLRNIISQEQRYISAFNTFKVKYNCLAGDCINATEFFGAQDSTPATCQTTASLGELTCNGNGNLQVTGYEMFRAWQHLAIAGLIEGQYTGVSGSGGGWDHDPGINAPAGNITNSCFAILHSLSPGDNYTYAIDYGNLLELGGASVSNHPNSPLFNPSDTKAIDTKIDDGMPGQGTVIARSGYIWGDARACSTSTGLADYTGSYNITSSTIACHLFIKTGFY